MIEINTLFKLAILTPKVHQVKVLRAQPTKHKHKSLKIDFTQLRRSHRAAIKLICSARLAHLSLSQTATVHSIRRVKGMQKPIYSHWPSALYIFVVTPRCHPSVRQAQNKPRTRSVARREKIGAQRKKGLSPRARRAPVTHNGSLA